MAILRIALDTIIVELFYKKMFTEIIDINAPTKRIIYRIVKRF